MASNFGLKIGLEGEKEFRNSLRDINTSFKVLGSEMNLIASQFDKNDRSVGALTARNELLNKEIDTQKSKISTLEKALQNAASSFGETDKRTQAWQIQLNNAKAELNGMERELSQNNKALDETCSEMNQAEKETRQFDSALDKSSKTADDASDKFSKLGSVLGTIGKAMGTALVAIGTAAIGAATGLAKMAVDSAAYADEILTMSTVTGMSTESLQSYKYAAELVDVSLDTLTGSMSKNIKSMSTARKGTGDAALAYKQLGISIVDSKGALRDSETVYWEAIDALGQVSNETERDALAMAIFGKSAQDLNPLIAQGSEGIAKLTEEAKKMGAVMSDDTLAALGAFDDSIQRLKSTAGAAKNMLGTVLLPQLQVLADDGAALLGEFTSGLNAAGGDWSKISEVIGTTIGSLTEKVIGYLPQFIQLGLDIVGSVGGAIMDNLPTIIDAAVQIVMTLLQGVLDALPQLTEGAVQLVLALVEGILANLPAIIEGAILMVVALVNGISQALPQLVPAIVEAIILIAQTLIDNMPLLLNAAMQLIDGLATGLLVALPILVEKLPEIILAIVDFITNNLPLIIEMGLNIVIKLAEGLIMAIPELVAQLPQIVGAILVGLAESYVAIIEVGRNMVRGLWDGIAAMIGWLKDKIKGFLGGIVDGVKGVLGIQSPSTVFAGIGDNMAKGLGEGFDVAMNKVSRDIQSAIPTSFDTNVDVNGQASSAEKTVRHQHSGTIRIEGVNDQGQFMGAVDAVLEQLKMDALLAGY